LEKVQVKKVTFDEAVERFRTKMVAGGSTAGHVVKTKQRILRLCHETGIDSVVKMRREAKVNPTFRLCTD